MAMTTELWLDFLGIRLYRNKVEGKAFMIDPITADNGEKFVVELSNETQTNIVGFQAEDEISRSRSTDQISKKR